MTTLTPKRETAVSPSPRANLSAFAAMVRKEFIVMLRYPVEFIASFAQIFLIITVLTLAGLMFAPKDADAVILSQTTGLVVYGFVVFLFVSDTLWAIGFNVRREQKQGTLEQLYLSPASKFAALASRVVITLVWTGLLSIFSVILMTALLGDLPSQNEWLALYIFIFTLSGTFGIGFAFAAVTLKLKEAAQTAVNLLQFGFMILCAPFFPFSALPEPLLFLSRLIPLSYCVDAFRTTLMGYSEGFPELASIEVELGIVTLFGIFMPIVGYWLYRWAEDNARRKGSLSEY